MFPLSLPDYPFEVYAGRQGHVPGVFNEAVDQRSLFHAPFCIGSPLYPCGIFPDKREPLFPVAFPIKREFQRHPR